MAERGPVWMDHFRKPKGRPLPAHHFKVDAWCLSLRSAGQEQIATPLPKE